MTTIAANAGPERTNKWLLIGGLVLALITGVLVFVAVGSVGGDDGGGSTSSSVATGDTDVLVAKSNIRAGTKLDADMFRVATFAEDDVVPQALNDPQAIVGETTTTDLLQGQQLSRSHLVAATDDARVEQLAFKIPEGHRGVAITVSEVTAIGGNLVPGDRVDVVVQIRETERINGEDKDFIRVHTVLQNVLVVAREQTDVERVVTLPDAEAEAQAEANAENNVSDSEAFQQRPDDVDPDAGISTVSVALTPDQVQMLVAWDALGEVTLAMRPFGDEQPFLLEDVRIPVTGE
jgi:Flp pilus assembly protein CpaB